MEPTSEPPRKRTRRHPAHQARTATAVVSAAAFTGITGSLAVAAALTRPTSVSAAASTVTATAPTTSSTNGTPADGTGADASAYGSYRYGTSDWSAAGTDDNWSATAPSSSSSTASAPSPTIETHARSHAS